MASSGPTVSNDSASGRSVRGFLLDPQVRTLQTVDAREMVAELVDLQTEYLDDWDLDDSDVLAAADAY